MNIRQKKNIDKKTRNTAFVMLSNLYAFQAM